MDDIEELIGRLHVWSENARATGHRGRAADLEQAADRLEALTVSPEKLEAAAKSIHRIEWDEQVSGCENWDELDREFPDETESYRRFARAAAIALGMKVEG